MAALSPAPPPVLPSMRITEPLAFLNNRCTVTCTLQALVREGLRTGMAAQLGVAAGAVVVALANASAAPAMLYSPAATVASAPTVRPLTAAL